MTFDLSKLSLLGSGSGKGERPHPLDALTPAELELGVELIKAHVASESPGATPWFKHLTLLEPPKAELVPWLLKSREGSVDPLDRRGTALISLKLEHKTVYTEYVVSLSAKSVIKTRTTEDTDHAPFDVDEMLLAEQILLKDPEFIKVVDKLKLPQGAQILADSWPYGADKAEHNPRWIVFMCYFRLSSDPDSNHYSLPLPFIPAIDPHTMKLVAMNFTPIFGGESTETIEDLWAKGENFPWEKLFASEYKHDLQAASSRPELKPYQVVQPEGPSFQVDGQKVTWQNWDFRIGFNFREGVTLHDVKYQGRDTFHRLSISDMTVPYGDPRTPYHRKQAFDLGDVGAGICANELSLGCDCLGTIHYFSANFINSKGHVQHQKNVVCLHEQDEGLGWKHTHYRTGNASVTRNRVLVVQMVITVANYEYVFAWKLDQAANIHLETRATGILSTHLIMPGETSPYGNIVNPGVLAPNHQHLFSIRIDPAIGALGEGNTVVQEDSVPMPFDRANPPANNPWGVGYTVEKTVIEKSGWADAAPFKNRVFKIVNPSRINPVSQRPISYKLVPQPSQLMLCHPDSVGYARAEFGGHHIWVTKHRDNELYSGGEYTNQSTGNAGGIKTWVARDDTVENEDLVLWHTFGLTHNPRVEDFPVMPCETHMLSLKPADFFTTSPAIDVPSSTQAFNKSVLTTNGPNGTNGSANGAGATNGSCCQK